MPLKSTTYQSSTIFYHTNGKGRPVLLLHGFGEDGRIWNEQVDFLKNNFRLIVPDLPGSGKSALITDMSIEGMAEVIKKIFDAEEIKNNEACIIGHSMGGHITLAFAEKYSELLHSFGLFHSSAFADSEEKKSIRLKSIEFIKKNGAVIFLKTSKPGLYCQQWLNNNQQKLTSFIERSNYFTAETLIQYYQAMYARPDRTNVLKNFDKPILFIIGQHDLSVPFTESLKQCYLPNQADVNILRNSSHMGMLEETKKVNRILKNFIPTFL